MRSRGYGNHLLQTHQMKLTQVSEKRKPHVSEKAAHVSEKRPHVSEKPITVVSQEIVTTKRVYMPRPGDRNLPDYIFHAPDKWKDDGK